MMPHSACQETGTGPGPPWPASCLPYMPCAIYAMYHIAVQVSRMLNVFFIEEEGRDGEGSWAGARRKGVPFSIGSCVLLILYHAGGFPFLQEWSSELS